MKLLKSERFYLALGFWSMVAGGCLLLWFGHEEPYIYEPGVQRWATHEPGLSFELTLPPDYVVQKVDAPDEKRAGWIATGHTKETQEIGLLIVLVERQSETTPLSEELVKTFDRRVRGEAKYTTLRDSKVIGPDRLHALYYWHGGLTTWISERGDMHQFPSFSKWFSDEFIAASGKQVVVISHKLPESDAEAKRKSLEKVLGSFRFVRDEAK